MGKRARRATSRKLLQLNATAFNDAKTFVANLFAPQELALAYV